MSDKLSDVQIREPFVWPFALTDEEVALWITLSDRMRRYISARFDEIAALEQRVEGLEDALEHCGYDPTDCIDCGGPPHNEWCRFWKLRDIVPILFASQEEA